MQIRYLAILDLNGKVVVEHIANPLPKAGSSSAIATAALADEKQHGLKDPLTQQHLAKAKKSTPTGLVSFKSRNQQLEYYLSFNQQHVYVFVMNTYQERLSLSHARNIFHKMEKGHTIQNLTAITRNPPQEQTANIRDEIERVKEIMLDNIEKALERGEKIELLVDKSNRLATESAPRFKKATGGLTDNQCCKVCCCDVCCCDFSSCLSWFKRNCCCCCGPCTCNSKADHKSYGALHDVDISRPGPSKQTMS